MPLCDTQWDISGIALDLPETHRDDFFSVPEDNPLKEFLQTADEAASLDSDPEQAAMALIKNQPSSFAFMLLSFTNGSDQKRES